MGAHAPGAGPTPGQLLGKGNTGPRPTTRVAASSSSRRRHQSLWFLLLPPLTPCVSGSLPSGKTVMLPEQDAEEVMGCSVKL